MAAIFFIVFLVFSSNFVELSSFNLDERNCETVRGLDFKIIKLTCNYRGPGIYRFLGGNDIQEIDVDRISEEMVIIISDSSLKKLNIKRGSFGLCNHIITDVELMVTIHGKRCGMDETSSTTSNKSPFTTTLPKTKISPSTYSTEFDSTPQTTQSTGQMDEMESYWMYAILALISDSLQYIAYIIATIYIWNRVDNQPPIEIPPIRAPQHEPALRRSARRRRQPIRYHEQF